MAVTRSIPVTMATFTVLCSSCIHMVTMETISHPTIYDVLGNDTSNETDHHGNETEHEDHHGVHLASINYDYVKKPLIITVFLLIVALCKLGFHHANFLSSKVPESCLLIILGTIVGAIMHFTDTDRIVDFSSDLFFLYLLPPIILEAAYSLHDRVFFENLGTILLYAVIGTVMNCFILSPVMYGLALCGAMGPISVTLIQCFVFGALIVAVDPVAVLAIFQEIGVNSTLYFLVFGESLLNDAVTVVIYNTMKEFSQMDTIPVSQIFLGIAAFFTVSLGGLTIGLLIGAVCSFITKYTSSVQVVEPLAIFSFAYAAYLLAELFHWSGIISIIGCGLMQAQYAFPNISHKSHTTVVYFSKMLSATCDCVIFMFLGLSLVSADHVWHTGFILWAILLTLLIRFGVVYFLTFFANRFQRLRKIDWEEQFIMAYGGLRGAVAFSLVSLLDEKTLPNQAMFETATLAVIIFTVFVQGISIKPLVRCLRITSSMKNPVSLFDEINDHVTDHVLAGIEEVCGHYGHNRVREKLDSFDNNYLRRWLMRDPRTKDDSIMAMYERIALQMHFENVAGQTMWQEYTSECELYKPELIEPGMDDVAATDRSEIARKALDDYVRRHGSASRRAHSIYSRAMTIGPASPLPYQRGSVGPGYMDTPYQRGSVGSDTPLPRKSTVLSDDVFKSVDHEDRLSGHEIPRRGSAGSGHPSVTSPTHRRHSRFSTMLKQTFSEHVEDSTIAEPSLDDIRRWMVKNPKDIYHRTYDRNLTHDDNTDLLHHLQEKQLRNDRRRISLGFLSPTHSLSPSPYGTPRGTPRGSQENISGRPRSALLDVITEGVPMAGRDGVAMAGRDGVVTEGGVQRRYRPNIYRRSVPGNNRLVKSATTDPEEARRRTLRESMLRAKTLDQSKPEPADGDTTPLLQHSPDGTSVDIPGIANPDHSSQYQPKFRLSSDTSKDTSDRQIQPVNVAGYHSTRPLEHSETINPPSEEPGVIVKSPSEEPSVIVKSPSEEPSVIVKSPSGHSIKCRGHLTHQKTVEVEDAVPEEATGHHESAV